MEGYIDKRLILQNNKKNKIKKKSKSNGQKSPSQSLPLAKFDGEVPVVRGQGNWVTNIWTKNLEYFEQIIFKIGS